MPATDAFWRWSAVDLARAIAARQISCREVVGSALQRLDAVNPRINAVVDVLADEALAIADDADAKVARGDALGPLHGVPVTVKINVDYAGRPTTVGVVAFKDDVVADDSPSVANLRRAGAIIIGRTNVPAFCARFFTDNDLHGRTINPLAADRTPGGSSGGAAAAVATGIGAIAHGTDRAGSIRYPAYACGVVGLRPSFGRLPSYSANPSVEATMASQLMSVQGPLARTVADVHLGLRALNQPDARDPWWVPAPLPATLTANAGLKIAVFEGGKDAVIDPVVKAAVGQAARIFEQAGCQVEAAEPPHFAEAASIFFSLVKTEESDSTSMAIDRLGDAALRCARAGTMAGATKFTLEQYVEALGRRSALIRAWQRFMEAYDVLLLPVSYRLPFPIDEDQKGEAAVAALVAAQAPLLAVSTVGFPALAMPVGREDGLPIGVQLVAGRFREDRCLQAAAMIEEHYGPCAPVDPSA
ncbi:MAG: amidase [Rhizobiales bacterium 62-17]|nr:amidase [Hyphomicrobiales bacterium]OJY00800.1 MAG: amidase [Rhizobiales bacterium 62-17]